MNGPVTSKLPDVGTTIFTVMSQLAADCDAINLSQGVPGFDPPGGLVERVAHYLRNGANQYAPMAGTPALRDAVARKTARLQGRIVDPETEITVCSGATEGLFSTIQAIVRPGDEVIVLDPAYDAYEPAVTLAGGRTRRVPLAIGDDAADFHVDWQRLHDTLNDKTRLVVVNFPHNPTGTVLTASDLQCFADVLRNSGAYVLADEVYEHVVFDGATHRSVLSNDALWPRSFVVSSFGKTFHATGWKIGYCIAPANLSVEFRKVHQFTTFAVNTPAQHAIADYLDSDPAFYEQLSAFYQHKRDLFCELLAGSRFRLTPTKSTFFQILDYGDVSDEDDVELAQRWTREIGVASIPLSVFCEQPFMGKRLRFCFSKDDETLHDAAARLRQVCDK